MLPSKKKSLLNICVILSLSQLLACPFLLHAETHQDEIIAVLNDAPIYRFEVERNVAFKLYRLRAAIYNLLKRETKEIVEQKLLDDEAARRGVSIQQLLQAEVQDRVKRPDESAIDRYLATHPKRADNTERSREQVRTFLYQRDLAQRKIDFLASLYDQTDFEFLLQMPPEPRTKLSIEGQPWQGSPDAPIVLVNFSDLASKRCHQNARNIKRAMLEYPGKIKWVHRNFFRFLDQNALAMAQFGEWTYEQGKFWEFHAAVLSLNRDLNFEALATVFQKMGLDQDEYRSTERKNRLLQKVKADLEAAQKSGVTAAPVIFVNGRYFGGTFPYERLKAIIEQELTTAAIK